MNGLCKWFTLSIFGRFLHKNSSGFRPRHIGDKLIEQSYVEHLPEPWDEEGPWTAASLLRDAGPQGKRRFFKIDIWHVVHMGVAKDFISSAMCLLQSLMDGSSVDSRFQQMSGLYTDWCKANRKIRYISKLTKDTFGGCGKRDEPHGSWNKAALSSTLMQFTEYLCGLYDEQCQRDERLRFVVPCLFLIQNITYV